MGPPHPAPALHKITQSQSLYLNVTTSLKDRTHGTENRSADGNVLFLTHSWKRSPSGITGTGASSQCWAWRKMRHG